MNEYTLIAARYAGTEEEPLLCATYEDEEGRWHDVWKLEERATPEEIAFAQEELEAQEDFQRRHYGV